MTDNVDVRLLEKRLAELRAREDIRDSQSISKALYGNGDDGGEGMEARIARLEATVTHIESDISDIKQDIRDGRKGAERDFRIIFGALIAATLGLAALMAHGFKWI